MAEDTTEKTGSATPNMGSGAVNTPPVTPSSAPSGLQAGAKPPTTPAAQPLAKETAAPAVIDTPEGEQAAEPQLFYAKIAVDGHEHGGKLVKKDTTIAVTMADYRWLLENKVATPGAEEDAGLDVDADGNAIKPESDEEAIARLEKEAAEVK